MLDSLLLILGLKKLAVLAGAIGGMISGPLMPGPLAVLRLWVARSACGMLCGGAIAGYCAEPLAAWLQHPDYVGGISLGLGLWGLTFAFKIFEAIKSADLGALFNSFFQRKP